jgi:hypothetical protein
VATAAAAAATVVAGAATTTVSAVAAATTGATTTAVTTAAAAMTAIAGTIGGWAGLRVRRQQFCHLLAQFAQQHNLPALSSSPRSQPDWLPT